MARLPNHAHAMNARQRAVLLAGSALLILAVLFPPAKWETGYPNLYHHEGFRFVGSQAAWDELSINISFLIVELLVIVAVTGALFFVLRDWNPFGMEQAK